MVFEAVGFKISIESSLLLACGVLLSTLLPLLPNGLGTGDGVIGLVAINTGMDAGGVVAAITLLRLAHIVACVSVAALSRLLMACFKSREFE